MTNMTEIARVNAGEDTWNVSGLIVTVTLEAGDYTTPDGYHHVDGVHRVKAWHTATGEAYKSRIYKGRARTFKGETAWMDGQRLFDDIVNEVRYGRRG